MQEFQTLRQDFPKENVLKNDYISDDTLSAYFLGNARYLLKEKVLGFLE